MNDPLRQGSNAYKMQTSMNAALIRLTVLTALLATLTACYTPDGRPDRTSSGALIGGASGAAIGSIADRRHPGFGALIGGAAGALTGGLIGNSMEQQDRARSRTTVIQSHSSPTSIEDIKNMSKAGVSDDVIINQLSSTRSVYQLNADAIVDLNRAGVSSKVISYMINTPGAAAPSPVGVTVTQRPPPAQVETVIVTPGPGYVWIGGEWVWYRNSWVWVSGRWILPPRNHAVWIEARWVHGPGGYHHYPGYWR